ncbi:MAG: metal ABC transporter substrate-binding protein, partial [Gammaproteobacteria bacterium]
MRLVILGTVLFVASCNGPNTPTGAESAVDMQPESAVVVASNYPLFFFANRIADGVDAAPDIVFPDIEGDPAAWAPDAEQIQQLQSADAVILNGAGAESWLNLITIDQSRLVDTSADINDRLIPLEDSVLHQHGPEGEHSHQGTAFTTWLDPQLAILQAHAVAEALIAVDPSGETAFRHNLATLEQELIQLDSRMTAVFAQLGDRPILFSHPVYQYLQNRYGITGHSMHWEPEEEPTTAAWIDLQRVLATHPSTIMIWEHEPLSST